MKPLLIVRADANSKIGTGHLMRSIALAHFWKARAGEVIFVSCCKSRDLRQRLADIASQVILIDRIHPDPGDWDNTSQILRAHDDAWVVIDGYHFDSSYQKKIRALGKRLLVIDDTAHLDHYEADIVLNQNINAERLSYSTASFTRLLLGTRYILLRPEFANRFSINTKLSPVANRLLVTFGGGDYDNVTQKVMRCLNNINIDGFEALIVVGSTNPYLQKIEAESRRAKVPMQVVDNVLNMAELMAWADFAVSAGGSTFWELAYMGVPALVITLAENQLAVVEDLEKTGVIVNLGWHHNLSPSQILRAVQNLAMAVDKRAQLKRRGSNLVDGKGVQRVLKCMIAL